ncbi:GNAT family N-acetyltransferase [Nocardiopsis coralliicola]
MIRPARPDDVPAILAMIHALAEYEREPDAVEATAADVERALFGEHPAAFCHLACDAEGTAVGFALWFLNFSTWTGQHGIYLEDLYVDPASRGEGHGRALLAELARLCTERGYRRLEWSVLNWNTPSIAFYRSLGAVPMDEWTVFRLSGGALAELGGRAAARA